MFNRFQPLIISDHMRVYYVVFQLKVGKYDLHHPCRFKRIKIGSSFTNVSFYQSFNVIVAAFVSNYKTAQVSSGFCFSAESNF